MVADERALRFPDVQPRRSRNRSGLLIGLSIGLGALSLAPGCSYDDQKALRHYDRQLAPVREMQVELGRFQARIGERRTEVGVRRFVIEEVMPRAKALLTRLQAVDTRTSEIRALHTRLVAIWVDYLAALERFTDMPEGESTQDRRHVMEESLRKLYERWKAWNVELQERAG